MRPPSRGRSGHTNGPANGVGEQRHPNLIVSPLPPFRKPVRLEEALWLALGRLELEAQWHEDDFLLHHQDTRKMRSELEDAEEILTIGTERVGYAKVTRRRHDPKPSGKLAHRWWYRCLERAGVVPEGTTEGMHMHRGRHTAATELQRSTMTCA